jgi:hypothetical protein
MENKKVWTVATVAGYAPRGAMTREMAELTCNVENSISRDCAVRNDSNRFVVVPFVVPAK